MQTKKPWEGTGQFRSLGFTSERRGNSDKRGRNKTTGDRMAKEQERKSYCWQKNEVQDFTEPRQETEQIGWEETSLCTTTVH